MRCRGNLTPLTPPNGVRPRGAVVGAVVVVARAGIRAAVAAAVPHDGAWERASPGCGYPVLKGDAREIHIAKGVDVRRGRAARAALNLKTTSF